MLVDLLSSTNYVSYNIKIAEVFGLHTAVYLAELININEKAQRKNKFIDEKYIHIERKYITERTTLVTEEQRLIEDTLAGLNIIEKNPNDKNSVLINLEVLTTMLMDPNEKLISDIKIKVEKEKKPRKTAREADRDRLKRFNTATNPDLHDAYNYWIDGVYANPKGFLSEGAIKTFMSTIDAYSKRNLDVALAVINIATVNGYRDATWAIQRFEESGRKIPLFNAEPEQAFSSRQIKVGNEVF